MNKQNRSNALHKYLKQHHTGRKKAISGSTLETVFNLKGSEIRKCVNALRSNGIPICSDENGYYYASSNTEIVATVAQLDSRIAKISKARNGMSRINEKI